MIFLTEPTAILRATNMTSLLETYWSDVSPSVKAPIIFISYLCVYFMALFYFKLLPYSSLYHSRHIALSTYCIVRTTTNLNISE